MSKDEFRSLHKISVSVKNNRLVFATWADYERAVNGSKPEVRGPVPNWSVFD